MLNVPINTRLQLVSDFMFIEPRKEDTFHWFFDGHVFQVRLETRNGRFYWYMVKMLNGSRFREYLSPCGKLSANILNEKSSKILAAACPDMQISGTSKQP